MVANTLIAALAKARKADEERKAREVQDASVFLRRFAEVENKRVIAAGLSAAGEEGEGLPGATVMEDDQTEGAALPPEVDQNTPLERLPDIPTVPDAPEAPENAENSPSTPSQEPERTTTPPAPANAPKPRKTSNGAKPRKAKGKKGKK